VGVWGVLQQGQLAETNRVREGGYLPRPWDAGAAAVVVWVTGRGLVWLKCKRALFCLRGLQGIHW